MNGGGVISLPTGNEIQPAAGRNPVAARSKSSLRSDEICALRPQTKKPRNHFGFGASFTLAAIYSRGTCRPTTIDVLMFHFRVRNGTGWDHQAMTTRLLPYFVLRTLYFVLQFVWLSSALAGSFYLSAAGWHPRGLFCAFPVVHSLSGTFDSSRNCLSPGWCIRSVGC